MQGYVLPWSFQFVLAWVFHGAFVDFHCASTVIPCFHGAFILVEVYAMYALSWGFRGAFTGGFFTVRSWTSMVL